MDNILGTVALLIITVILVGIFPMMAMADRSDDIDQLATQTVVAEFVNNIVKTGKITMDDYNSLVSTLYATGNTYDISMEARIQDDNPSKKTTQAYESKLGENIYYSVYTTQIMEKLQEKGKYLLKDGDRIIVKASNSNNTISQMLKNFFYSLSGNSTYSIVASQAGVVTVTGS